MARKLKFFLESLSITINNTWNRQLSITLLLSETGWLKWVKFDKFYCQDQEPSTVSNLFVNLTPLIAHLSSYDSHSRKRDNIWRSSRRKRVFWMFPYHVLHRLHEIWISIFIVSKNLRAAGLVQNQAELSPVFNCVLSVQSL